MVCYVNEESYCFYLNLIKKKFKFLEIFFLCIIITILVVPVIIISLLLLLLLILLLIIMSGKDYYCPLLIRHNI